MRTVSAALQGQRGFTLAELLVAFVIVGLILAGLLTLLMAGSQSYLTGANQVEAQGTARAALERMAQEIRGAGYNPQGVTTFNPIVGASACPNTDAPIATAFMIQSDTNGDGTIQATECVSYTLNGTNLQRRDFSVDATPQTIMGGIQGLTFTYWKGDGSQIIPMVASEVPNIRSIQLDITTEPETQPGIWQAGRVRVQMIDRVRIRNR